MPIAAAKFDAAALVDQTNEYLLGQSEVLKSASFKVVQAGQLRLLSQNLPLSKPITMDEATTIISRVRDGPWDDQHKDILGAAINKLQENSAASHGAQGNDPSTQSCAYIEHYMTDAHFAGILDLSLERPERYVAAAKFFEANRNSFSQARLAVALHRSSSAVLGSPKWG